MKENIEEVVERLEKSINDVWFSTTYSQEDEERDLRVLLSDYKRVLKENEELKDRWDKDTHKLQNDLDIANAERIELKSDNYELNNRINDLLDNIPIQKIKEIIKRIDYDIKKTKEIILNNTGNWTSNRKNEYQIVRLKAMNTKSLEIKNRLQDLLEEKGE